VSSDPRARHQALHLRIAAALEDLYADNLAPQYPLLANHYESGGDLPRAAGLLERAGDEASARKDAAAAAGYYRAAYRLLNELPEGGKRPEEQVDVAFKLAHTTQYQVGTDHIPRLEVVLRLAREMADRNRIVRALFWLSRTHHAQGHITKALEYAAEGRMMIDPVGDPRSAALMEIVFGHACLHAGRFVESAECLKRGLLELMDDFGELAYAHGSLAMSSAFTGHFPDAYAHIRQALALVQPGKAAFRAASISLQKQWVHTLAGDWNAVKLEGESAVSKPGIESESLMLVSGIRETATGYANYMAGWIEGGLAAMRLGLSKLEQSESRLTLSLCAALFAEVSALTGLVDDAERYGRRALGDTERGERYAETIALRALALAAAAAGRLDEARSRFAESLNLSEQRGGRTNLAVTRYRYAEFLIQNGNRAGALPLLAEASQAFADMGMSWWFEQAARLAH
jgi:tetratricopeptide (TPR) repeat protein